MWKIIWGILLFNKWRGSWRIGPSSMAFWKAMKVGHKVHAIVCVQPVIVHVLRRFGCQLCRGAAVEMGKIFPQLEASGVRIVGVGKAHMNC
jgi:hypothetical protein